MRIAICQLNPKVGAITQNVDRILSHAKQADLLVCPELALCGYPPKDLVFSPDFIESCQVGLQRLAKQSPIPVLLGCVTPERYNAAYVCANGQTKLVAKKRLLPNYQIFDEKRYFVPGKSEDSQCFEFAGLRLGVHICEDGWSEVLGYEQDPVADLCAQGCDVLINLSASPFELGKPERRETVFRELARKHQKMLLMSAQVGANEGLIFDGGSTAIDSNGEVLWRANSFEEDFQVISC